MYVMEARAPQAPYIRPTGSPVVQTQRVRAWFRLQALRIESCSLARVGSHSAASQWATATCRGPLRHAAAASARTLTLTAKLLTH